MHVHDDCLLVRISTLAYVLLPSDSLRPTPATAPGPDDMSGSEKSLALGMSYSPKSESSSGRATGEENSAPSGNSQRPLVCTECGKTFVSLDNSSNPWISSFLRSFMQCHSLPKRVEIYRVISLFLGLTTLIAGTDTRRDCKIT